MKRIINLLLFSYLILSFSVSCNDFEPVSPYEEHYTDVISYHHTLLFDSIDCNINLSENSYDYAVYNEGDYISVSLGSYEEFLDIICLTEDEPTLKDNQAYIELLYNDTIYHSFKGGLIYLDSLNMVYSDAFYYKKFDRTYTAFRMVIGFYCK